MTDEPTGGTHTYPLERAGALDDPSRYRYCSREELLELLEPHPGDTVADLGAGTGFYTRDVAPFVDRLYALDAQPGMLTALLERGCPSNCHPVVADIAAVPLPSDHLDAAVSTMTHHEYAHPQVFAEIARVLAPAGRLVTVDWSADGDGADGPPVAERVTPEAAAEQLESAGLAVETVRRRPETFLLRATPAP